MTDKQQSEVRATAAALETLDMGGVADLVRSQYAELETLRAKLKVYEDLGGAADDVQLLRMGYAAARLEIESLKAQPAAQQLDIENLRRALRFYADGEHFIKSDDNAWDTVSGEPQNYWCDEAGTATVEDGSIARLALSGQPVQFEDDTPQSEQPGAAYAAQDSEHQRAIMEGERNASLDAYSRVVSITSAESRLYERAFTSGWDRRDRLASYGQAPAQAAPATVAGPSPTAGMTLAQRILHVGGRNNAAGYVEFGSAQAVEALIKHVLRDISAPTTQPACQQEAQEPFAWHVCSVNSDGSLSLEHAAAWEEAAHDHINDAITELDIEGAGSWVVRPAYHAPQTSPAAQEDALDAARWHWFAEYLVGPRTDLDDEIVASETVDELRKLVDAARAAQEGKKP